MEKINWKKARGISVRIWRKLTEKIARGIRKRNMTYLETWLHGIVKRRWLNMATTSSLWLSFCKYTNNKHNIV